MEEETKGLGPRGQPSLVEDLHEDLDVAIREFLDRHPCAGTRRVRQAIRIVERGLPGGRVRRLAALLAQLAVFVAGLVLGLSVG